MCVAFFMFGDSVPGLRFLLLFNRDEVHSRPASPAHWWEDRPGLLGGRDGTGGGTWLCVGNGRVGFLTNYRDMKSHSLLGAPTRGALAPDWVRPTGAAAAEGPLQYLTSIPPAAYAGFNLVVADLASGQVAYLCNKGEDPAPVLLQPGVHGISNGRMDDPWPKVEAGKAALQALVDSGAFDTLESRAGGNHNDSNISSDGQAAVAFHPPLQQQQQHAGLSGGSESSSSRAAQDCCGIDNTSGLDLPWAELFGLLSADERLQSDPSRLPKTGYGPEFEAAASSIFLHPMDTFFGRYSTRSQIVLAVAQDGRAELRERFLKEDGSWGEVRHTFHMPGHGPDTTAPGAKKAAAAGDGDNGAMAAAEAATQRLPLGAKHG